MADHLAQDLIHLGDRGPGSNGRPKLCLNHREGALYVGALVVLLQELAAVELVVVPHLPPQFRSLPGGVALEGDVRHRSGVHHGLQVADVAFVGGQFGHLEPLRGRLQQRRKERVPNPYGATSPWPLFPVLFALVRP